MSSIHFSDSIPTRQHFFVKQKLINIYIYVLCVMSLDGALWPMLNQTLVSTVNKFSSPTLFTMKGPELSSVVSLVLSTWWEILSLKNKGARG